ncbi:MAG: response regulator transcription factor [Clostridia bacterium]
MDEKIILVVEDDKAIQNLLKLTLKTDYKVEVVSLADEAIDFCIKNVVDLVILDLGLPDKDGMYVLENIRSWSKTLPILIVSARSDDDDKVKALDAGANDYIQKPFSTTELLARVRVSLRNNANLEENSVFTNGDLTIDYSAHSVYLSGLEVHFTNFEYKVICLLAQNVGKTLTHNYIISHIWGVGGNDKNGLRVFMAAIRRKLEKNTYCDEIIRTEVGVGYRMNKI